jgi:hypothetical protein
MKNNKSVTAVEWLVEELGINHLVISKNMPITNKIFQQAKEMEKQQIIDAHNIGRNDKHNDFDREGEQYYNETFKNTNKYGKDSSKLGSSGI